MTRRGRGKKRSLEGELITGCETRILEGHRKRVGKKGNIKEMLMIFGWGEAKRSVVGEGKNIGSWKGEIRIGT